MNKTNKENILKMAGITIGMSFEVKGYNKTFCISEDMKIIDVDTQKEVNAPEWIDLVLYPDTIIDISKKTKREVLLSEMLRRDGYWCLLNTGERTSLITGDADQIKQQGNFGTKANMDYLSEKRKVEAEIRFMMSKYPDNVWDNTQEHWYASLDITNKKLVNSVTNGMYKCTEYMFPTEESLQETIDFVSEWRWKFYILGGNVCIL